MTARLANKVAVITGGAGGIGRAVGALYVEEGANVLLVDRDEAELQDAAAFIGRAASYVLADVSVPEEVQAYVHCALDRYGGIDVFVNNAGIEGAVQPIVDYPLEVFDAVMAVNVRGAWLGLKHVIPAMEKRGGGSIMITSSIAGVTGSIGLSAYATSKHAVIGMMRSAALECAPLGIRVNTVNPGVTETRMMRSLEEQKSPGAAQKAKEAYLRRVPLRRYALPEDVAQTMLFLASDESQYCTGAVYMVDGGWTA